MSVVPERGRDGVMARTADAGAAILYEQHPDDDAGRDPIREAAALRRGDPLALRRAAQARLDAYEAAIDARDEPGHALGLRLHATAYRALLLLDLRGLEVRFGMEDGEPRLHG